MNDELENLVTAVTQSAKYRQISPDLVARIGAEESGKRRSQKEAVKATKNKLHQVAAAYQESKIDYARALTQLTAVRTDETALRQSSRTIMSLHASTRERLPILAEFYSTILADLPPIHSLIDIACGLNPLTIPWLNLANDARYTAYDIYGDMMAFLQDYFDLMAINGRAQQRDVIGNPPTEQADLVLILKTLPCLEQVDKTAATSLLDQINGRHLLISYPAKSLGGRSKGMVATYDDHFARLADGRGWQVQRFQFETELAFLVTTAVT